MTFKEYLKCILKPIRDCANDPVMYVDPSGHYYYVDENGKGHVSEITVSGSMGLNPDIIYDKVTFEDNVILRNNEAQINSVAGNAENFNASKDLYVNVSSTGSYDTFNINGSATIVNRGFIDTINMGKESSLLLYNEDKGKINFVNLGEKATAQIYINNKEIDIETGEYVKSIGIITGGTNSKINVINNGGIVGIRTGAYSKNEVDTLNGNIDWLETGLNNGTNTKGYIKKLGGSGTITVTLYKLNEKPEVVNSADTTTIQLLLSNGYSYEKPKTYWDKYEDGLINHGLWIFHGVDVGAEYQRYLLAAKKLGVIKDALSIQDYVNTNGPIWEATEDDRSILGVKKVISLVLGFTPVDVYKDSADLLAGKDIITGEKSNRIILALCLISPEIIDKLLKGGLKQSDLFLGSGKGLSGNNWKFDPIKDIDLRSSGKTYKDAIDEAFRLTGLSKSQFKVKKWGKDVNGKSVPVEWEGPNGASVNIDIPEWNNVKPNGTLGEGPHQPHIGYQTPGKGTKRIMGHIFVDDIPVTRR